MSKRSLYVVCKTLDQPIRVIGLPLDEFIPGVVLMVIFFILGKVVTSLSLALIAVILMRVMKKGQGSSWLINICYWNLPSYLIKLLLRHTPNSAHREWIS